MATELTSLLRQLEDRLAELGFGPQPLERWDPPADPAITELEVLSHWFRSKPEPWRWRVLPGYDYVGDETGGSESTRLIDQQDLVAGWAPHRLERAVALFQYDGGAWEFSLGWLEGYEHPFVFDLDCHQTLSIRVRFTGLYDFISWVLGMWTEGGFVLEGPNRTPRWVEPS